jgi:hypothetical protein
MDVDRSGHQKGRKINPCNFVLWGYLKEKLFPKRPASIMKLRALFAQM